MPFKHLDSKDFATGTANYKGHHREHEMQVGIGYFPLGDRNRHIDGNDVLEERDSLDGTEKWLQLLNKKGSNG